MLSRPVFPFWPVEQIALDLTGGDREGALAAFLTERFGHYPRATFRAVEAPPEPEDGNGGGETAPPSEPEAPPPLWWHAVRNLARRIEIAAALAPRQLGQREARLTAALDTLDAMHREHRGTLEIDQAEDVAAAARADLDRFTEQVDSLPHMATALAELVSGRDDWEPLTPEEVALVEEILAELHGHYGDTVSTQIPTGIAQLSTLSQRAMVSGDETALDALPDDTLARINTEHALANLHQHRIFALDEDGRRDVLLLQLGYDDLMEWRWSEMGAWRFRIPAEALRTERWDKATLAFETA
ncbi:hypothetical protein [Novosphingobium sp. 9]|uniref:hypothetical protein n=1 Tax=Novosphingobium sp. 9 TaxID=2025349 RepID=UPI0021B69D85|nr:hypothetical protein [Novosphingobium sp. 9]